MPAMCLERFTGDWFIKMERKCMIARPGPTGFLFTGAILLVIIVVLFPELANFIPNRMR